MSMLLLFKYLIKNKDVISLLIAFLRNINLIVTFLMSYIKFYVRLTLEVSLTFLYCVLVFTKSRSADLYHKTNAHL